MFSLWLIVSNLVCLLGLGHGSNLATFKYGFYYFDNAFGIFDIKG